MQAGIFECGMHSRAGGDLATLLDHSSEGKDLLTPEVEDVRVVAPQSYKADVERQQALGMQAHGRRAGEAPVEHGTVHLCLCGLHQARSVAVATGVITVAMGQPSVRHRSCYIPSKMAENYMCCIRAAAGEKGFPA